MGFIKRWANSATKKKGFSKIKLKRHFPIEVESDKLRTSNQLLSGIKEARSKKHFLNRPDAPLDKDDPPVAEVIADCPLEAIVGIDPGYTSTIDKDIMGLLSTQIRRLGGDHSFWMNYDEKDELFTKVEMQLDKDGQFSRKYI